MRRALSIFLTVITVLGLLSANAAAGAGSAIIGLNPKVDVLITTDDTYGGSAEGFVAALQAALAERGMAEGDVRISAVESDISLTDFNDWYVYDHYYNYAYPSDGTAPAGWDSCSGKHPYYYYADPNASYDKIGESDYLAAEAALHNEVWSAYEAMVYRCGEPLQSIANLVAADKPYSVLTDAEKEAADAAVLSLAREEMAQYYYWKKYDELTEDQKNDAYFLSDVTYVYANRFNDFYGMSLYNDMSADEQKSYSDYYILISKYYTEDEYASVTDEEKAAMLSAHKASWYDSYFSAYMSSGESFGDANLTEERKAEIISNHYYDSYIFSSDEIIIYAQRHFLFTDITTPGSLDRIYHRDRHIYTNADAAGNSSMTFLGYGVPAFKDFLIYPTSIDIEKVVTFDIDASKVSTHTLEGAGFLINAGIDGMGYLHGYLLFYDFYSETSGTVYLYQLNDSIAAEAFHNEEYRDVREFATEIVSQSFSIDTSTYKKRITVTITPTSLRCAESDYTGEGLSEPTILFSSSPSYNTVTDAVDLTLTGYHGFGPMTSYEDHYCDELTYFTFSNLTMGYAGSVVDNLRNATFVNPAKKVYIVLAGEGSSIGSQNEITELLGRLKADRIYLLQNIGLEEVTNGLYLGNPATAPDDAADFIRSLANGALTWSDDPLNPPSGTLPIAIFDIVDASGMQLLKIDNSALGQDSLTVRFGNIDKSVSFLTEGPGLTCQFAVYDPNGNAMTLAGENADAITLTRASIPGRYTFVMTVSDGVTTSLAATRTLTVVDLGSDTTVTPPAPAAPAIVYSNISVNGKEYAAGTTNEFANEGRSIAAFSMDSGLLGYILKGNEAGADIRIPILRKTDIAYALLTGRMIKEMETRGDTIGIRTELGTFSLPAALFEIDKIAEQFGSNIGLEMISVNIRIAKPTAAEQTLAENAAAAGGYTLVVPPVIFRISCTCNGKRIEVEQFAHYVTRLIEIPATADYSRITTAVIVEEDGSVRHVPTKITEIDGKYYAQINSMENGMFALICHPVEFADAEGYWAETEIEDMGSRLVVNGISDSMFDPQREVTRAEFTAMIARALGIKPGLGTNSFSDVDAAAWYYGYVTSASEYGIVAGSADGTFGPDEALRREEAMHMIARAMEITDLRPAPVDDDIAALLAPFADAGDIAEYARESVAACLQTGVVLGKSETKLAPTDTITRAEATAIIRRLLQKSDLI